jgi:hypothetical protein
MATNPLALNTSMSARGLIEYIRRRKLGEVDSRDWHAEWKERWVVFVDLIAFANRSVRSRDVVLNNILRFDRASQIAREAVPTVKMFRFSDSTFAVAHEFTAALSFAIAIHHACLALNAEYMDRVANPIFIHTIVPRVTLAWGSVLDLPDVTSTEARFDGIDAKSLIAGEGIVNAYNLEKTSAGGLLTTNQPAVTLFGGLSLRGGPLSTQGYLKAWQKKLSQAETPAGLLFARGKLLDVPWLLLRPVQEGDGRLWCAAWSDASDAIAHYLTLWELGAREFYTAAGADNPIDTSKHFSAALRHGIQCVQSGAGQFSARYYSLEGARKMLARRKAA